MKKVPGLFILVSVLFLSCGGGGYSEKGHDSQMPPPPPSQAPGKPGDIIERKIIKEGEISFKTGDMEGTASFISKAISETDSYVSDDREAEYYDRVQRTVVIKVPAAKFDLLLNKISDKAGRLENKNISLTDVTEDYIDIESRIKTKKELQEKYRELLKKAVKVDEILNIEKEIGELQSELESVEGRMKYLNNQISMSTLTVTYYTEIKTAFGFPARIVNAIKNGWDGFLSFVVGLVSLWVFIILGIVILFTYRKWRRRKNKK